jgi:hypothetical protein
MQRDPQICTLSFKRIQQIIKWYGILALRTLGLARDIKYPPLKPAHNLVNNG